MVPIWDVNGRENMVSPRVIHAQVSTPAHIRLAGVACVAFPVALEWM
jgi:hypothetical protein